MTGRREPHRPRPGEVLPGQELTLTREDLRRYAEASGDHNPIHLDDAVAREFGLADGVIAHGMLVMGRLAAYVQWALEGSDPTAFRVRFRSPVRPGVPLVLSGRVVSADGDRVVVEVAAAPKAGGGPAVTGEWTGSWGAVARER